MGWRRSAALGDGWHVGVVGVSAADTQAVLDVLGIANGPRFHLGRMAVPGGVTYLVVAPPTNKTGVTPALTGLCARYDPPVLVLIDTAKNPTQTPPTAPSPSAGPTVQSGRPMVLPSGAVVLSSGPDPVDSAVTAFFAAAGEPAALPGYGGTAPFQVVRGPGGDTIARFCASTTTRTGKPLTWAAFHGTRPRDAAQALRYLIPYLRPLL